MLKVNNGDDAILETYCQVFLTLITGVRLWNTPPKLTQ